MSSSAASEQTSPCKVVICDDHSISQLGIQYALQEYAPERAFQFWKASSGQDAVQLVHDIDPDILTLDLHLPDISGLEVLKKIRHTQARAQVLILTSEESPSVLRQLMRLGANAILLKSYTIPMLEKALKHLEQDETGRTYLDPSLESRLGASSSESQLTSRELEVLQLLLKGHTNKSVATILGCSPETIKTHRARIMEKTEARNRAEMISWFQRGSVN